MSVTDIVAIIGAFAWAPYIIQWVYNYFKKPEISIIVEQFAEVGFTIFGQIFNIRIAMSLKPREVVINNIGIIMKHESGEIKHFSWRGITHTIGKMKTPDGSVTPYEKDVNVLAIKLNPKDIEERKIIFQEDKYLYEKQTLDSKIAEKSIYLQKQTQDFHDQLLLSQEMDNLISFMKQSFNWKAGKYQVEFVIEGPEKIDISGNKYEFTLTPIDISMLEHNKDYLKVLMEDIIKYGVSGYTPKNPIFVWRYPAIIKSQ
jgi:hypothetical protein